MPQSPWDQYNVPESQAQSPWEQYNITEKGTAIPTVAQRPGMPAPPNLLPVYPTPGRPQPKGYAAQGYTEQQPFVLPHGPEAPAYGTPQFRQMVTQAGRNVDPKLIQRQAQAGVRQAPMVLGAAAAAGPAMIAGEGALPGAARAMYPFASGAAKGLVADYALKAAQHLPFVGERIQRIPHSKELMEALPLIWGAASEARVVRGVAGAAEKVAADKAAGKVIGGEEKELLKDEMAKVFSGKAKVTELRAMSKELAAGKKAGQAAAKEAEKALEQSKPLGGLGFVQPNQTDMKAAQWLAKQGVGYAGKRYAKTNAPIEGAFQQGGVVPKTGNYILHEGEAVLPNFSWTSKGKVGDAFQGMGLARTETPMSQRGSYYGPSNAPGMIAPGNIDLYARPQVRTHDGKISTLRSISIDDENGNSVLIPTVVGNKIVSDRKAVEHYLKTGEHLGKFTDFMSADAHSYRLHSGQESRYQTGVTPLGSFQQGTSYVPQTGPYQLHQGEMVIPNLADPTTGRAIAAAVPGQLTAMGKRAAQTVYDANITNIVTQMYKRFKGQPNTLNKIPKAAVNVVLNQLTADMPGLTDMLTMTGMPEAEGFTKWLAGQAPKAEKTAAANLTKPTTMEVPRGVRPGSQVEWSPNISKRMQEEMQSKNYPVAWPPGQELPPGPGETYRHGYRDPSGSGEPMYPSWFYDVLDKWSQMQQEAGLQGRRVLGGPGPESSWPPGTFARGSSSSWNPQLSREMRTPPISSPVSQQLPSPSQAWQQQQARNRAIEQMIIQTGQIPTVPTR